MENLAFGLSLTLYGMGTVFGLLLLLMLALQLIGWSDRRSTAHRAPRSTAGQLTDELHEPVAQTASNELSPDLLAAITIAVITHARVRRGQAAPAMRRFEPGSQLFASRWVAVGRSYQNQPWRREN